MHRDRRINSVTDELDERPSKSERKRAAHAAQSLGEQLIELNDAELAALALPEALVEAIRQARRITSRGGLARQRQYIGRLMREIDCAPIEAALNARRERDARETQLFKRAERWRERLLAEGESALEELLRGHPEESREAWAARLAAAREELARAGAAGGARRELFRAVRSLLARSAATQ